MVDSPYSDRQARRRHPGGGRRPVSGQYSRLPQPLWADFWPLVLIGAGLLMLWSRLAPPIQVPRPIPAPTPHAQRLRHLRRRRTQRPRDDFRGGHVSAMFGGVEVDLRRAGMRGDSAVIDVTVMFGGVEFKIPPNWIGRGSACRHLRRLLQQDASSPSADTPGVKRLYHQRFGHIRRRGRQELKRRCIPF